MPAAVSTGTPRAAKPGRDAAPPAKKAKLVQSPAPARQNGLKSLLDSTAAKPTAKPTATTHGAKNARSTKLDESAAVVGGGQAGHGDVDMEDVSKDVIEISSAEEESQYSSSDDDNDDNDVAPAVNGDGDDEPADPEDLSFGDRLRAQEPEPVQESRIVDVETTFGANDPRALAAASTTRPLSAPSASSLGTVLTQALRTNDQELLDSCLRVIDIDTIYATVERLPSPLVGNLLQKLAERLHKKPGRAGVLMVWVQWSLAAHGGYLASQPHLVRQLATLNKVLKERASGLQPLLSLKGRLDMLQAQLELRRRNQKKAAGDDEDEAVIYVEGEDDYESSVDEEDDAPDSTRKRIRDVDDDDESSDDEMPTTMEVDEDSDEGSEDSEGLIDDEAEETDDDAGDDMSEPMSDDLDEGEGVSSEEETKPAKRSTIGRAGLKSRR